MTDQMVFLNYREFVADTIMNGLSPENDHRPS